MKIEAGDFELLGNTHYRDIVLVLQHAEQKTETLTFLEGWSNREYIELLGEKGFDLVQLEECLKNCEFNYDFITPEVKEYQYEGYLYPDTYEFGVNETASYIFNKMLTNFDTKTKDLRSASTNFNKTIIKASLIEREVRDPADRKIVAGIIENRLKDGMRLDMDATILYVLQDWDAILDYDTLQTDSPYNTRKFAGLPPSPICNPSIGSIVEALRPAETPYYYYLNASDGTTYFAETLAEHNRNKALYLR